MSRDYKVYLEDILTATEKVLKYTAGLSQEALVADEQCWDAVIRNLEVIGEAAKKVPEVIRQNHPEIEWRKMAGMRDMLIHEYFGIDVEIVWDIIENKLPELQQQIKKLL